MNSKKAMPPKPRPPEMAKQKPKTQVEWSAYRLKLTCEIGRNELERTVTMSVEHAKAFHAMFSAIAELGTLMVEIRKEQKERKTNEN